MTTIEYDLDTSGGLMEVCVITTISFSSLHLTDNRKQALESRLLSAPHVLCDRGVMAANVDDLII